MATASTLNDRSARRMALVEEHVRLENAHDLQGVLGTFGDTAQYDDEAWGEHYQGRNGVRDFYQQLMRALPDLEIEVKKRHVTADSIVLEVMIRAHNWASGAAFQQPGGGLRSRSAVCTPSIPTTAWPGKESTTIEPQCCTSLASSTSRKAR